MSSALIPRQIPAPIVEGMARHGKHAQELANKNGRAYAMVSADHNGRRVVHLRLPEDVSKSEKIIAVFHPDVIDDNLPNLYPDDFDRWMAIARLVWYVVREHNIPLEKVEPKSMPFPDRPAVVTYSEQKRIVIAVRHRQRKKQGGTWAENPVPWRALVPEIVHGLASLLFDDYGRDYRRVKLTMESESWAWLQSNEHLTQSLSERMSA
jgi:hypothetical protein